MSYAYEEYEADVRLNRPEEQRLGQWAFNRLVETRPDIAAEVLTSSIDPSWSDARVTAFLWFVKEVW